MTQNRMLVALGLAAAIAAAPSYASAQSRGRSGAPAAGRAVPRTAPGRAYRPSVVGVVPYRPYYHGPYRPGVGLYFGYGYPGFYGAYGYPWYGYPAYGYPFYGYPGYGYPGYGYPGYPGYGYPGYAVAARPYGSVRLEIPQKDAEVYVDGYFAGNVDNFDGRFHHLNLEPGPHKIEVRAASFEPITFDVNVEPGQTITYRAAMRPAQPGT